MKNVLFIDDGGWNFLQQRISSLVNIELADYSEKFVKRRVEIRMKTRKISSYLDYSKLLLLDKNEVDVLSENLSIHVTRFFRDAVIFDCIKNEVIPSILKMKELLKNSRIRIWSAGCSSGEEAISILICLLENLDLQEIENFDIKVIGTDRDTDIIKKAKENSYEPSQFNETKRYYLNKYFDFDGLNYHFKPKFIKMISYEVKDINKIEKRNIDIVLCRNTVIYFGVLTKNILYKKFFQSLNEGGFFVMGKTEVLLGEARKEFEIFNNKERIFRKPIVSY